jgi:hypothetical protein
MDVGLARFCGIHPAEHAFADARDRDPSAVVVFADQQRIRAMVDALIAAADSVVHHRLGPVAEAELRSTLVEAPVAGPLPS